MGGEHRPWPAVLVYSAMPINRAGGTGYTVGGTYGCGVEMQGQRNGHTILVGEDELEVRAYLEIALKCLGYTVELAQDGEEVLNCLRLRRSQISAVLLDLLMP